MGVGAAKNEGGKGQGEKEKIMRERDSRPKGQMMLAFAKKTKEREEANRAR